MKVTTQPTIPNTERVNQTMIINRFLRETESGGYGTVTTAGSNAAQFFDTDALKSGQYTEEELEKCWIRCNSTTDGNAPQGQIRPVSEFLPELGRVSVSPAFTTQLEPGDTYQFFRWPHPQKLIDHIDTILTQETWLLTMGICTEVPDGDMELSTAADWSGSSASLAKATTEPKGNGRRYLQVQDSGGGGGFAQLSEDILVEEGESYHLSAMVRCNQEGEEATLMVWDETNAVAITSITVERMQWVRPYIDLDVPDGCRRINIRLISEGSGAFTYWDDVCFFAVTETSMALPNYIESRDQIKKVFRLTPGDEMNQSNVWSAEYNIKAENGWDMYPDHFTGRNRLRTRLTHSNMPLVIFCTRKEEAFSNANTDYKMVNPNWMHAELCVKVFESLSSWPGAGGIDSKWIAKKLIDYEKMRNSERYKNAMRMDKILTAPSEMKFVG